MSVRSQTEIMLNHVKWVFTYFAWNLLFVDSCRGANKLEWGVAYWLLKDESGCVSREAIRSMYDGSVFYYLEKKQTAKSMAKFL